MSKSRFTAQEMRKLSNELEIMPLMGFPLASYKKTMLEKMLRQAADSEEENARLRVDADLYRGAAENWERRANDAEARLDAVVRECKRINDETFERSINKVVAYKTRVDVASDAICHKILRAARGEVGAEGGRS